MYELLERRQLEQEAMIHEELGRKLKEQDAIILVELGRKPVGLQAMIQEVKEARREREGRQRWRQLRAASLACTDLSMICAVCVCGSQVQTFG